MLLITHRADHFSNKPPPFSCFLSLISPIYLFILTLCWVPSCSCSALSSPQPSDECSGFSTQSTKNIHWKLIGLIMSNSCASWSRLLLILCQHSRCHINLSERCCLLIFSRKCRRASNKLEKCHVDQDFLWQIGLVLYSNFKSDAVNMYSETFLTACVM